MSAEQVNNKVESVERGNSPESREMFSTHERLISEGLEYLKQHHSDKPYHGPEHTYGQNLDGKTGGVLGNTDALLEVINHERLNEGSEETDLALARELGAKAGAAYHDAIMEISGVDENENPLLRKVVRKGGWKEGKNEYESFELLNRLVEESMPEGPLRDAYLKAAESAIKATVPKIDFAELPAEYIEQFDEDVQAAVSVGEGKYMGLRIDASEPPDNIAGLVLTTADLAAARSPEVFFRTGNQEFWELNYGLAEFATEVLASEDGLKREDAALLLTEMKKWRSIQVGVALWQRIRLESNFSASSLAEKISNERGVPVSEDGSEVIAVQEKVLGSLGSGMEETIVSSAATNREFLKNHQINESNDEYLSGLEVLKLRRAIEFMGGAEETVKKSVESVRQKISG